MALRSTSTPLTNDSMSVDESMEARMASTLASGCCCLGTGGPPPMKASISALPVSSILMDEWMNGFVVVGCIPS